MIDTIKITLNDYEVKRNNKLTVQPSTYNCSDGSKTKEYPLIYYSDSKTFDDIEKGSKAFYNSENFNLSVVPKNNIVYYQVQMSVPKVHNGNNYYSVGKDGTIAVFKKVEKELKEVGISTNIFESKISRLDTFKNIVTEESFQDYNQVFSNLDVERKHKRDYGTTFLYENSLEEFCIYDKIEELKVKGLNYTIYPKNTMRFENRLLKPKKVKSCLNLSNMNELLQSYDSIREYFKETMEKNIFKYDSEELKVFTVNEISSELEFFFKENNKQAVHTYIKAKGLQSIISNSGIESFIEAVTLTLKKNNANYETIKKAVQRVRKDLKEHEIYLMYLQKLPDKNKTLLSLYNELKQKVLS